MNLKEYLFYKEMTSTDLAKKLNMHPTYVNAILRGSLPLSPKFAYVIELYTKGVVTKDSVLGPPSYPNIENILGIPLE